MNYFTQGKVCFLNDGKVDLFEETIKRFGKTPAEIKKNVLAKFIKYPISAFRFYPQLIKLPDSSPISSRDRALIAVAAMRTIGFAARMRFGINPNGEIICDCQYMTTDLKWKYLRLEDSFMPSFNVNLYLTNAKKILFYDLCAVNKVELCIGDTCASLENMDSEICKMVSYNIEIDSLAETLFKNYINISVIKDWDGKFINPETGCICFQLPSCGDEE